MMLGPGLMIPLGALQARHRTNPSITTHQNWQMTAMGLMVAGLIIALVMVAGEHFGPAVGGQSPRFHPKGAGQLDGNRLSASGGAKNELKMGRPGKIFWGKNIAFLYNWLFGANFAGSIL